MKIKGVDVYLEMFELRHNLINRLIIIYMNRIVGAPQLYFMPFSFIELTVNNELVKWLDEIEK